MERKIELRGVRVHNLKNIDVSFPSSKLIVVTGLSGSGKSSLVFDTLFAEGQRRYVESLSSYARQFLGRMNKPELDSMEGISPAIAIEQKSLNKNPRSTVGTVTEIYEYIKLLYARLGRIYSPISGNEVRRDSVSDVTEAILKMEQGSTVYVLVDIKDVLAHLQSDKKKLLEILAQMGYSRLHIRGELKRLEELDLSLISNWENDTYLLIDRFIIKDEGDSFYSRVFDSIQTAFNEGGGRASVEISIKDGKKEIRTYSNLLELDGMSFVKQSLNFFSFNNSYGACKYCGGIGNVIGLSEDLVIPDPRKSIFEGAVACWRGEKMDIWKEKFIKESSPFDFPIHKPYQELSEPQKELLWEGNTSFGGIRACMDFLEENPNKLPHRVLVSKYKSKTLCPKCKGTRLRADAQYVKIEQKSVFDLVNMPIGELLSFIESIKFNDHDKEIASRILIEIKQRLGFLNELGLSYLTLNRSLATLSGGESQRVYLANSLGSALVGSMYILDEPSIGLHPRDTHNLIGILKQLRDMGNTVIVVEHDDQIMQAADYIIDIGPLAGRNGGELVFQGEVGELLKNGNTLTAKYLRGELEISIPSTTRAWTKYIEIKGARENNLKNIDVKIPLNVMVVVSGVSGSGKTSLIKNTLYPALKKKLDPFFSGDQAKFSSLEGDWQLIKAIERVDQDPIGRSSRSNPVTYVKAFDSIRFLFAAQALSKARKYSSGIFSFNVEGGRCEQCQGEGTMKVEMQFMADLFLVCDQCQGKRYKAEVLEVVYRGKNIADVLEMTIDEAYSFFLEDEKTEYISDILYKLKTLQDVGLGYLSLGQSSNSLSGGEAQRIKLAYFLAKKHDDQKCLFIFDEPTTGLHLHDIVNLQKSFDALIRKGHSIIVIEHHLDIIKLADWLIDIGPEGGKQGGELLFQGNPRDIIGNQRSQTALYLKSKF